MPEVTDDALWKLRWMIIKWSDNYCEDTVTGSHVGTATLKTGNGYPSENRLISSINKETTSVSIQNVNFSNHSE